MLDNYFLNSLFIFPNTIYYYKLATKESSNILFFSMYYTKTKHTCKYITTLYGTIEDFSTTTTFNDYQ